MLADSNGTFFHMTLTGDEFRDILYIILVPVSVVFQGLAWNMARQGSQEGRGIAAKVVPATIPCRSRRMADS
jgi:hypothetical protein